MMTLLYIVVPCYNEREVLPETSKRLLAKLTALTEAGKISPDSKICFVDDGSKDDTWNIIKALHESDPRFTGLSLSRNRGHQNALLAGLMTVKDRADAVISMDSDLQDDIDAVDGMLDKFHDGCDIVYGVRSGRETDSFFKRFTAETFYRLLGGMGVETVFNHADYRLLSRRALEALSQYKEVNLFLRGMVPLIGFRSDTVEYARGKRFAGESKYPLKKMLQLAVEGITSLSIKPIRLILTLGILSCVLGAVLFIIALVRAFIGDDALLYCILASVWFIGGLILSALGVVGEYVGKAYLETKARPRYIIREDLENRHP